MLKRLFCFFILFFVTAGINSLMIPLSVEELAVASDTIISGEVTHIESYLNAGSKVIYSKITIQVDELLWGQDMGPACEMHIIGGTLGDITLSCPDYPQFVIGEQAVFFLSKDMQSAAYHLPAGKQAVRSLDNLNAEQKRNLHLRINKILQLKK